MDSGRAHTFDVFDLPRDPSRMFEFKWEFPADGFEWQRGRVSTAWDRSKLMREDRPQVGDPNVGGKEWVLVSKSRRPPISRSKNPFLPSIGDEGLRTTVPLRSHPALFRSFASLDPTDRDAIRNFADTFGPLGVHGPVYLGPLRDGLPRQYPADGEPLEMWSRAILGLRRTLRLWDVVEQLDVSAVSEWVRTYPASMQQLKHSFEHYSYHAAIEGPDFPPDVTVVGVSEPGPSGPRWPSWEQEARWRMWSFFKLRHVRKDTLFVSVSDREPFGADLFAYAISVVGVDITDALAHRVQPTIAKDPSSGRIVLIMLPDSLLAAMWLQFAHAITGNKQYRKCKECDNWFEISSADDARTARRLFCSDPCKSRDYRRRKDRAAALRAEGVKPRVIADRLKSEGLETDIKTIQSWVSRKRK